MSFVAAALGVSISRLWLVLLVPFRMRPYATVGSLLREAPSWLKLGFLLAINQVLVNSITQIDILMLGWLSTSIETANYHVASRISYATVFFFASVASVTAPTIARLFAAGDSRALSSTVRRASLLAFLITLGIALFILTLGNTILALFGRDFSAAELVMRILVGSWVLHAAFGLNHTLLTMTDGAKIAASGLAGAALLNILLNALLVPLYGAEGAAVATLISSLSFTIAFWIAARRQFGFSADTVSAIFAFVAAQRARQA